MASSEKNYKFSLSPTHEENDVINGTKRNDSDDIYRTSPINNVWREREKNSPTAHRLASPVWSDNDVIDSDERLKILDDFVQPRDVTPYEDSDYSFVRPRQVHFLPSAPRNQRLKHNGNNRQSSPVTQRSDTVTPRSPTPSRVSPEFSSLIRANGGSLEAGAMKPPTDRFFVTFSIIY